MKIAEIFESISGEPGRFPSGSICTFIRLQGCNLKCDYCDSSETQSTNNGEKLEINDIFDKVVEFGNQNILITGGEPLMQIKELELLIDKLNQFSYSIQIETNGTIKPSDKLLKYDIAWIVDYKKNQKNFLIDYYTDCFYGQDIYLKFIIDNKLDIVESINIINFNNKKLRNIIFIFSPMNHILIPSKNNPGLVKKIFNKIKDETFSNRSIIGHQLHKYFELK